MDLRINMHMPSYMLAVLTALRYDREYGWGRDTWDVLQLITMTELHCWLYHGQ